MVPSEQVGAPEQRAVEVSVIVPAYRAAAHLPACLTGLLAQSAPRSRYEVLVVDDASPDGTAEVASGFDGVRVLRCEANGGAAAARNRGAKEARGAVLLFVDSDVTPSGDLVQAVIDRFAGDGVRAATGRYQAEPANGGAFARYKALWTWHCWEVTAARTGRSGHLQGALAAVRREVFEAVGGFDARYEGGNVEDYELSARLAAQGVQIAFDDRIAGRHLFPGMGTVARNYWDRTRMWVRLAPEQRGFSSGQANKRSAVAAMGAFGGAAGLLFPPLLPLGLLWFGASAPFLGFVARREGPAFAAYAAGAHFALSAVVGAAALSAPFGAGSRRA